VNFIVLLFLYCRAGTVHCEYFHCGLHCLVGAFVRLRTPGARYAQPWALGLLAWVLAPQRIHSARASLGGSHARAPLGDTWHLSHDTGPKGLGPESGPMINEYCVRTQFYWILHQNPRFLNLRILNIIICFINIIIFIIINIINKIINNFERKYYYYYYWKHITIYIINFYDIFL
jgi:hypothetical protein